MRRYQLVLPVIFGCIGFFLAAPAAQASAMTIDLCGEGTRSLTTTVLVGLLIVVGGLNIVVHGASLAVQALAVLGLFHAVVGARQVVDMFFDIPCGRAEAMLRLANDYAAKGPPGLDSLQAEGVEAINAMVEQGVLPEEQKPPRWWTEIVAALREHGPATSQQPVAALPSEIQDQVPAFVVSWMQNQEGGAWDDLA